MSNLMQIKSVTKEVKERETRIIQADKERYKIRQEENRDSKELLHIKRGSNQVRQRRRDEKDVRKE